MTIILSYILGFTLTMRTYKTYDPEKLAGLLRADPEHPHIHIVDMPYRTTSIWQDHGCEIGVWEKCAQVLAWAVFQPAWWNLDYAIHPSLRGSTLEQEIFAWGKDQMTGYSQRSGEDFWGSVEIFKDTPNLSQTLRNLEAAGFTPFDWSTLRFELDLSVQLPPAQLPEGYHIRPLQGESEVDAYVNLHRAAFGSEKMTAPWRLRTLQHPAYRPELDLIVENEAKKAVGFCVCWLREAAGQIEPLGIHPDDQGQGLGSALEIHAYQALKKQGARSIHVDHVSLNDKAIALSLKTGFRQTNNALRYYVDVKP